MKKTIYIFGALLLSLCILASCSGGGGGSSSGGISGAIDTVKITHCWTLNGSPDCGMEFTSDGKAYNLYKSGEKWYRNTSDIRSYSVDGSKLTMKRGETVTDYGSYSISGDTLTFAQDNGKEYKFTKASISPESKTADELKALGVSI